MEISEENYSGTTIGSYFLTMSDNILRYQVASSSEIQPGSRGEPIDTSPNRLPLLISVTIHKCVVISKLNLPNCIHLY